MTSAKWTLDPYHYDLAWYCIKKQQKGRPTIFFPYLGVRKTEKVEKVESTKILEDGIIDLK